ncbi:hypothetical protein EIN_185240 [Entamoeba invadens IP1]|uniref:hypothetical protein n=1 Tax=Entamoeba invadens IP1 TaxID=370355 RepID=UPI0002C3F565|nr:hypothetical protein EIN_185240 [Entamoeba invadens IP1]ELP94147.1 hypothetical protein EIN_185240 [Entamoeba invadens IP1]|eukprot:XP_004260918.1 hypothetical protein EIN_185240 [Entamoeba invadens IP1]
MVENNNPIHKICVVGDEKVGKTTLIRYLCTGSISSTDLDDNTMILPTKINLHDVNLLFCDCIQTDSNGTFFNNTEVVLLMFALDNKNSFINVSEWLKYVQGYIPNPFKYAIVATCSDKPRVVSAEEGRLVAEKVNAPYLEISLKSFDGLVDVMQFIYENISVRFYPQSPPKSPKRIHSPILSRVIHF